nr:hypothetical protein [uncultured Trichococcus sp.]
MKFKVFRTKFFKECSDIWKETLSEIYNLILKLPRQIQKCINNLKVNTLKKIQTFSYSKVIINVLLTFIFPIILFSIPILQNDQSRFTVNFMDKIKSGVLFSTSISILATIISSYLDGASVQENNEKKQIKDLNHLLPIILIVFLLTFMGAFYYGKIEEKALLNSIGMKIQICLYIAVQIIYGLADSIIKNSPVLEITSAAEVIKGMQKTEHIVHELSDKTDDPSFQDSLGNKEI